MHCFVLKFLNLTGLIFLTISLPIFSIFRCCSPKSLNASLALGCGSLTASAEKTSPIALTAWWRSTWAYTQSHNNNIPMKSRSNCLTCSTRLQWSTNPRYITSVSCSSCNFFTKVSLHKIARDKPSASAVDELMFSTNRCLTFFKTISKLFPCLGSACNLL